MSRWIDANKLIEFINSKFVVSWKHDYDGGFKDACIAILNAIEEAPSIELVRCGECKHWKSTLQMPNGTDVKCLYGRKDDDFCSYGCREEE